MKIKLGDKFEDTDGCVYELIKDDSYETTGWFWLRDVNDNEVGWEHYKDLDQANEYINYDIKNGDLKYIDPLTDYDKMLKIKELLEELKVSYNKIDKIIEVFCEGTHIHVINHNLNHKWNDNIPVNPFNHTHKIIYPNQYVTKSEVEEMINNALNNK